MEEIEIWRAANKIIEMFGDEAIDYTVKRAKQLSAQGDKDGEYYMGRIARAIEILQRPDSEGLPVH